MKKDTRLQSSTTISHEYVNPPSKCFESKLRLAEYLCAPPASDRSFSLAAPFPRCNGAGDKSLTTFLKCRAKNVVAAREGRREGRPPLCHAGSIRVCALCVRTLSSANEPKLSRVIILRPPLFVALRHSLEDE